MLTLYSASADEITKDFDNIKMHGTTMRLEVDNLVKLDEPEFGAGYPLLR